jgi:hypothetical protein
LLSQDETAALVGTDFELGNRGDFGHLLIRRVDDAEEMRTTSHD